MLVYRLHLEILKESIMKKIKLSVGIITAFLLSTNMYAQPGFFEGSGPLLLRLQRTGGSDGYMGFYNDGGYFGYAGNFLGTNRDIDFGTGLHNTTGKVNIVNNAEARIIIDPNPGVVIIPTYVMRLGGNVDGTAWRLGINGSIINREGGMTIVQRSGAVNNGMAYRHSNNVDTWHTNQDEAGGHFFDFRYNEDLRAWINPTTGAYSMSSDRKLKKDFQPLEGVLHKVLQLQPSRYHMVDQAPDAPMTIGLIAQDVQKLFPDVVSTRSEHLGINYMELVVVTLKAVQEQQMMIDDLKKEVIALRKGVGQ